MIIEAQKLKVILDLLLHLDLNFSGIESLNLEFSKHEENYAIIAANYGDLYYISDYILLNQLNIHLFL